jgi:hypothetical protein
VKPICDREGCEFFGQRHPKCSAHVKATREERADRRGTACRRYPSPGLNVCVKHGGGQPQARKAGTARRAQAKARAAVDAYGLARDVSPTEALLEEVQWAAGHVAWLREQVARFDAGPRALTMDADGRAILDVYGDERDRLVRFAKLASDAGVDERRIELAEQQGALVATGLRGILDAMLEALLARGMERSLAEVWPVLVGEIVPGRLRALTGGGEGA